MKKNSDKRTYLRARGLHKNQKMGAVKVFYNQCQFIEHMKMHRFNSVNMADLILMPIPINMSNNDWSSAFEILCEALMERAFLLRIHIIDWLKMYDLQDNWWKLINGRSNDNMINKIVDSYQGRQLFVVETHDESTTNELQFVNYSSSDIMHSINKNFLDNSSMNKNTNNYSPDIISDKNILENEDNPCTPSDITFVDCGPTSQYFEPEIPMNYAEQVTAQEIENCHLANTPRMNNKIRNEAFKDHNLHETDMFHENAITIKAGDNGSNKNLVIKQPLKDYVQQYTTVQSLKKTAENNPSKTVSKISDNSVKISIPFPVKKNTITKINLDHSEQNLQTLRANNNSKILTLQDPKNIASIISQLPSHLISNKRIVVIGQDSRNIIAHSENELTSKKDSSISINTRNIDSSTSTQKTCDSNIKKQEVTGKIIIKNGKKYLIKRTKNIIKEPKSSNLSAVRNATKATKQPTSEYDTSKSKLTSTNFNEIENIGMEQTASLHNNDSLLTPSPSPSELSSSSSCELHVKKTSIMPKLQKVPPHLISISAMPPTQRHVLETISLIKEENGDLYMDIKIVDRITKESFREVCDVIIKYRREMFDEFYQMNRWELKERIDHLQNISKEMKQVLNFMSPTVFKEKLRSLNTLKCILEECFNQCNQNIQEKKSNDAILNYWEKKINPIHKCQACNKFMKPKSYIVGFSKLSKNDNTYCSCYKQVCHVCLSYQGNMSRFISHQNFHKMSKPYICPDCLFKFDSATSLEVHTWTACFHTSRNIIFTCKICEIDGFRDLESITRHFVIMHSKTKVGCEDCFRVFFSYNEYVQHCRKTHPSKVEENPIRLVICKLSNVILRCENYISYLEKYPGIRKLIWFKCPFCHLITTENKHVTTLLNTHIRNNHKEPLSKVLSKEAFTEIFGAECLKTKKGIYEMPSRMPSFSVDLVPRIVNTRTISSEIFEHGSQDAEDTWSTDVNEVTDESPETMKKIDDKKKRDLLPKIINVRSIDDMKPSKSKEAITKVSTETKKKSSSPSLQFIIETGDGKADPLMHEEAAMELGNNKSNSNEETAKKPDEGNNELAMNVLCVSESEKLSSIDTVDVSVNSPIVSRRKVSNFTTERSTDGCIKIVDFRKICKPDIEQFVSAKTCDTQINKNASNMESIPKPPPLARIPQHLLESVENNEPENEPVNSSKVSKSKKPLARRVTGKSKMRIALGTNTQMEEGIDYLCHLCNERINTSHVVIRAHFREKHSNEYTVAMVTPQLSRMSSDFINGGYKQFINNKKRKSDSALFASKRKRRWTPKKHVEMKDANTPAGLCVEQETAEDGEGNFICKKCGQRCTDISDLREHIAANHRLKGRYLICLECGENFVVAPSLQMHLKAFHGIEDSISYMNQNPSYAPDGDSQTEERTTVANQCYVCMAVFEDKAAVDKHLRVHGMAFLNRKRIEARNALEKKTITEDKPNVIKNDSKKVAKQDKPAETILEKINVSN